MSGEKARYVTVSLPIGITQEIDFLMEELGYWPSRGAFVREACLEKIREERRRLMELNEARERTAQSERGEEPRRGTRHGSPREKAWRLDAPGLIARIERVSEKNEKRFKAF